MTEIAKRLRQWVNSRRRTFDELHSSTEVKWSNDPSPNRSAFVDGQAGNVFFRIVAWELGQTELQVMRQGDTDCSVLNEIPDLGASLEEALDQHLRTLSIELSK
jgi:hypothetical protein